MAKVDWIANLSKRDRIDCAKSKVDALVSRVCVGLATRASNRAMRFPEGQKGVSRAAVCFNHLLASQLKFEALMLASIWDKPGKDRNSIPTVFALVNDSEILKMLRDSAMEQYPTYDATGHLTAYYQKRRAEEVALFDERWLASQETCNRLASDPNFALLRDFRDFEIAHTISGDDIKIDRDNIRLAEPFWNDTVECVGNLYSAISLAGFDFSNTEQINTKNAKSLWESLVFSDPQKA